MIGSQLFNLLFYQSNMYFQPKALIKKQIGINTLSGHRGTKLLILKTGTVPAKKDVGMEILDHGMGIVLDSNYHNKCHITYLFLYI